MLVTCGAGGAGRGMVPGGYTGRVYREGYTGVLPSCPQGGAPDSEAGPGRPAGPGVGGLECRVRPSPVPTHSDPCRVSGPAPLVQASPRAKAPSGPIRARLRSISWKLSQNGRVSPKYVEKACHSPCLQNELKNSPLEILRFPILLAFSHKELMVPFWA